MKDALLGTGQGQEAIRAGGGEGGGGREGVAVGGLFVLEGELDPLK